VPVCCKEVRSRKTQKDKFICNGAADCLKIFVHISITTLLLSCNPDVSLEARKKHTAQFRNPEYSFELKNIFEDLPAKERGVFLRHTDALAVGFTTFAEDVNRSQFGPGIFFAASKYLGAANWMFGKPSKKEFLFVNFTDGFLAAKESSLNQTGHTQNGFSYSHALFKAAQSPVNLREKNFDVEEKISLYNDKTQLDILVPYYGGLYCTLENFGKLKAPSWMNCHNDRVFEENGRCLPVGEHSKGATEFFAHENGNTCFFQVRPQDPQKPEAVFESELACVSPKTKQIKIPMWDRAQFIFPSSASNEKGQLFFVYEGNYQSAKVHKLDLKNFSFETDVSPSLFNKKKKYRSSLSDNRLFLYACEIPRSSIHKHYAIVSADIAYGQKKLKENVEAVWQVVEPKGALQNTSLTKENSSKDDLSEQDLSVVQSNWQQLRILLPALDDLPPGNCAQKLVVDLKCGIRLMKTVLQIHWELYQNEFKNNEVYKNSLEKSFIQNQTQLKQFRKKLKTQILSAFDSDFPSSYLKKKSPWGLDSFSELLEEIKSPKSLNSESDWQTQIAIIRQGYEILKGTRPEWASYFVIANYSQK
jgi:hypothetical protein